MVLVGTRPEVIKMAPVVMELRQRSDCECHLLSTGQHREMLAQALKTFSLSADSDLAVMKVGQSLPALTARLIEGVTSALRSWRPDVVLVQGDTTTVLAGALAAFYEGIPVGHVEAGLRTYNFQAPWPEEMNRRLTDVIARWCYAPTAWARGNLLREGIEEERVSVTGNTVVDALVWVRRKVRDRTPEMVDGLVEFAARYRTILVTAHRRESFGEPFERMCGAMARLAHDFPDVGLVYPVHLNPNVREPVQRLLGSHPRIRLIEPLGYEAFAWLMDRCYFILTDSGGVQEEAPSLGKPVLVMRDTTERPEGVEAGIVRLVGTEVERILAECATLLSDRDEYDRRCQIASPYGDGQAARRIIDITLATMRNGSSARTGITGAKHAG